MITVKTFFSDTLNTVDAVIGNYVNVAYTNFLQTNSSAITLLFTVYIIFLGYRFLNHDQQMNMSDVIRRLIVMLSVYAMVMNWHLYNIFVYNVFTNEPAHLADILVNSAHSVQPGTTIAGMLDQIYEAVTDAAVNFLEQVNLSATGLAFLFYAGFVFIIGSLLCIVALLLFIYAKMMMAVGLALGPLFMTFILWEPTKSLFSAWLSKLITIALIPVITSAILALMLSVISVVLPSIKQPLESMQFYGIVPFLGLSVATTLILSQVFHISSSLGGGITLASLSKGAGIVKDTLKHSGMQAAAGAAYNWSKKQFKSVKKTRL